MSDLAGSGWEGWFRDDPPPRESAPSSEPEQPPRPGAHPGPGQGPPAAFYQGVPVDHAVPHPPGPGQDFPTSALPPIGAAPASPAAPTQALRMSTPVDATQAIPVMPPAGAAAPTQAIRPMPSPPPNPGAYQAPADHGARSSIVPGFGGPDPGYGHPPQAPYSAPAEPGGAAPSKRRRGPLLLGGAGLVAVVVIAAVVLTSGGGSGKGSPSPSQQPGAQAPPNGGPAAPTATAADFSTESGALDTMLQTSSTLRSQVTDAVVKIGQCGDVTGAATTLRNAAGQRDAMVRQLTSLNVGKVAGGSQLVADLKSAETTSAVADRAFAGWADDMSGAGCGSGKGKADSNDANYRQGVASSDQVDPIKARVVADWSPIAQQGHYKQYQKNDI